MSRIDVRLSAITETTRTCNLTRSFLSSDIIRSEADVYLDKYISRSKDGDLNCASLVAGMIKGMLDAADYVDFYSLIESIASVSDF